MKYSIQLDHGSVLLMQGETQQLAAPDTKIEENSSPKNQSYV